MDGTITYLYVCARKILNWYWIVNKEIYKWTTVFCFNGSILMGHEEQLRQALLAISR
jgi:hypothetical protein